MSAPLTADEAQAGVCYRREVCPVDPRWVNITIRVPNEIGRVGEEWLSVPVTGASACRRLFLFCAAILHGAGGLTDFEAERIVHRVRTTYGNQPRTDGDRS